MKNKVLNIYGKSYTEDSLNNGLNFIGHLNGELVIASQSLCKILGYNSFHEVDCKKFGDLLEKHSNYNKITMLENNKQLIQGAEIIDIVVKFRKDERLILFSLMPIRGNNGIVVGVHGIGRYINLPSHMEIILKHSHLKPITYGKLPMDIELSSREQMIVSLLIAGFTQEEIGEYLGYSRGHIAKLIATDICPKFGLKGSSTKTLIKLAVYYGVLNNKIPEDISDHLASFLLSS